MVSERAAIGLTSERAVWASDPGIWFSQQYLNCWAS